MVERLTNGERQRLSEILDGLAVAVLATVNRDGSPQISPIWYRYADGRLTMSTTRETLKYRNVLRDSRISVCIYPEVEAIEYVMMRGRADVVDDESLWPETQAIVERHETPQRAAERMSRLRSQDRAIISLKPERVVVSRSSGRWISKRGREPPE